nr:13420_t:CDS:2 [Entrophospora candida]
MTEKKDSEFIRQRREIEAEYNYLSQSTPYKLPSTATTTSKLINTQQIAQLFQESQEQALAQEIKKMEKEINQTFTDKQKELIKKFIEIKKKSLKDEENEELMDSVGELKAELREERFSREDIGKIIEYCERKEIEFEDKKFEGQLVIEDYPELELLYLQNIKNVDKIEKLKVRKNLLTNLEFIKDLENLETLEIDGNPKIVSGLEYLPDLKKSREELKKRVVDIVPKETQPKTTSEMMNTQLIVSNLDKEFKKKEKRINYLESRIQELIDLNKQQKDKIINAYLTHFGSERELAKNLIESYLEFIKFKKKETNSPNYRKKVKEYKKGYELIEEQLENKLDEEAMNGMQRILTDCEKLIEQEIELEIKSGDVKGQKENLSQVSSNNEKEANHQLKLELAKAEDHLKVYYQEQPATQQIINYINCNIVNVSDNSTLINQYNLYYQQLANETEREISEPLTNLQITEQDKKVINQVIIFWGVQELFFNYRKKTIDKLVNCYCRLANKTDVTKK